MQIRDSGTSEARQRTAQSLMLQEDPAPVSDPAVLTVLDANLAEIHSARDNRSRKDIANFSKRAAEVLPTAPDVVMLQEVSRSVARDAARLLSTSFGTNYRVGVSPAGSAFLKDDRKTGFAVVRDTAVLYKAASVDSAGSSGFLRHDVKRSEATRRDGKLKDSAWITLNGDTIPIAATSAHLNTTEALRSAAIKRRKDVEWVTQLANRMDASAPNGIQLIAGDLNTRRTVANPETVDGEPFPFWTTLTSRGFVDSAFTAHPENIGRKRIDYIFAKGAELIDAGTDPTFVGDPTGSRGGYSDHAFHWAQLRIPTPAVEPEPSPTPEASPSPTPTLNPSPPPSPSAT